MRYAQTGIHGYTPPGQACAGHGYEERPDRSTPRMSVDCPRCEPWLAKDPLWSTSLAKVPLTELEQKAAEEAEAERDRLAIQNSADSAAVLAQTARLLAEISAKLNAAPAAEVPAPVPAAPVATAPVPGAAAPKPAQARKARAKSPAGTAA